MKQLSIVLLALAVCALAAQADSVGTTRTHTWGTWDQPGGKTVTIMDYLFELDNFATGVAYGPGSTADTTLDDGTHPVVTLRISRPGSSFQFTDLSAWVASEGVPADWGTGSLDPFLDMTSPAPFRFEVVLPAGYAVVDFQIQAGDFGPSDRDLIEVSRIPPFELDNNTVPGFSHVQVYTLPNSWGGPPEPVPDGVYTASGGGPAEPGSMFWDNVVFGIVEVDELPLGGFGGGGPDTDPNSDIGPGYLPATVPIPEPGTMVLLGAGLAALALVSRRRR